MKNTITISTENLGLTATRQLAAILEDQTGFKYQTEIWAHVVDNLEKFINAAGDNGDQDAYNWIQDYTITPSDEILEDISGFWAVDRRLEIAAEAVKEDPNNLFAAGKFDALAGVAAEMIAYEHNISEWSAYVFIYRKYDIDL